MDTDPEAVGACPGWEWLVGVGEQCQSGEKEDIRTTLENK